MLKCAHHDQGELWLGMWRGASMPGNFAALVRCLSSSSYSLDKHRPRSHFRKASMEERRGSFREYGNAPLLGNSLLTDLYVCRHVHMFWGCDGCGGRGER